MNVQGEVRTSMIDYVITNLKACEEVIEVEEGNKTESDHVSLEVTLEGPDMVQEGRREAIIKRKCIWTEEGVDHYHENCKEWVCTQDKNNLMQRDIKDKVKKSILKKEKRFTPWKIRKREWRSTEEIRRKKN